MRIPVGTIAGAAVLFAAAFAITDRLQRWQVWRADSRIRTPRLEEPVPSPAEGQGQSGPVPASVIRFQDVAASLGLDFTYYDGAAGNYLITETTGGGMAVLDYDNNGFVDLMLVNGTRLPVDRADLTHSCRLFRSLGPDGLEEVTCQAGVQLVAYGQGASAADYDNDGFDDILVTSFGRLALYQNNGDGTFRDMSSASGVRSRLWSTSAAFADLDLDGDLDLYVCTYANVSVEHPRKCFRGGIRMHCLPQVFTAQSDLLFCNQGDGVFRECARQAGIVDADGRGLGVAVADFDRDGLPDVFTANDTTENYLFVNQGRLRFIDQALSRGVAVTGEGCTMSGMGVACADYDQNGFLDLFVTNFYEEKNVLFQNLGPQGFLDNADAAGLGHTSRDRLGFGTVFLDADLDGRPDLFVANGHVSDLSPLGIPYRMRAQLYYNPGSGPFEDVSSRSGAYFQRELLGRGCAVADWNNDGLPDLIVSHIQDPAALLINRTHPHGHWIGLTLVGRASNRTGLNVKVELEVDGQRRFYESVAGGGYLSSSDHRLLVGLGACQTIRRLVVNWPTGKRQELRGLPIDRFVRITEP